MVMFRQNFYVSHMMLAACQEYDAVDISEFETFWPTR